MKVLEGYAPAAGAELYYREVGGGKPLVVVHGGPDFDHRYLLPDMDRLADDYRLVYYDQRGRGRSRGTVRLEDIHIDTYVEDLEALRRSLGLERIAVAGHSWGGMVALHYALRFPHRLTHLVLMNAVPVSYDDFMRVRHERMRRRFAHAERMGELTPGYQRADPEAVAEFYRIDFGTTFARPEELARLRLDWSREEILAGREIENRLAEGLIWSPGYTLLPALPAIRTPTLLIHGARDFIPLECTTRIAERIPGARLVVLPDSGHFSYIDAADDVRAALQGFLAADH